MTSVTSVFTGLLKQASSLLFTDRLFRFCIQHSVVNYAN